jgi:Ni,Fe-hydrogenase III small subunit
MFAKSLGIRHVNCGSCNGCEQEINALGNAFYDITREGWDIVASPRHADVITVTGPMTAAMHGPSREAVDAAPRPRVVLGIGDCAAGKGPWAGASSAGPGAAVDLSAEILVRGCPPTPGDIRAGLHAAASLLSRSSTGAAGSEPSEPAEIRAEQSTSTLWENGVDRS